MNNQDIVGFVLKLGYHRKTLDTQLKKRHPDAYARILRLTAFLPEAAKTLERLYCIGHGITERPVCPVCGSGYLKFNTQKAEYRRTCSVACTNRNPEHKKIVAERLNGMRDEINAKTLETCMARYGGRRPAASPGVRTKMRRTKLLRYGSETYNNRGKARATTLRTQGSDNVFKTERLRKASKDSLSRRSFDLFVCSGVFCTKPRFSFEEYAARPDKNHEFEFECALCGKTYMTRHVDGAHRRCPDCFPEDWSSTSKSKSEIQLAEFVKSAYPGRVETSNRSLLNGKELDVYVPDLAVAFEYDGLFWHNAEYRGRRYHLEKTAACLERGVRLVHVFEDEWLAKRGIVESRIRNLLGIYGRTIYARKCEISEIGASQAAEFLEANHLQGNARSGVRIGLHSGGELVAVMTFGKCRFDGKHEWELMRFCSKRDCRVIGGAGKMLACFERKYGPKSLVSYADRRWSDGGLYEALGFRLCRRSAPNYWYFNSNVRRLSRIQFQKHKLPAVFGDVDAAKSEPQIMKDNGYYRIFDCGNFVYEKTFEEDTQK